MDESDLAAVNDAVRAALAAQRDDLLKLQIDDLQHSVVNLGRALIQRDLLLARRDGYIDRVREVESAANRAPERDRA